MTNISVDIEKADAVAHVTVMRPKVLNALNAATINELHDAFHALQDDAVVRAVVLTGSETSPARSR